MAIENEAVHNLDCKGLSCPMPIVRVGQMLQKMNIGDLLDIVADDLAFEDDVKAFIEQINQQILSISQEGTIVHVVVKKIC